MFPVEIRARQFLQGAHRFRLSLVRDITERKRADDALRRSESYLAEAQRLSHTGTIVFNATGPVYWSEESYRIGILIPCRVFPTSTPCCNGSLPTIGTGSEIGPGGVHQKGNYEIESKIVLPDWTVKHLESTGHPLLPAAGELEIVVTHIDGRNANERKSGEKDARAGIRTRPYEPPEHNGRVDRFSNSRNSASDRYCAQQCSRGHAFFGDNSPKYRGSQGSVQLHRQGRRSSRDIVDRIRDHIRKAPPRKELLTSMRR